MDQVIDMRQKSLYLYLSLSCIHILIAIVAFRSFLQHSHEVLFSGNGDGLKNAFTLVSYVKEPIPEAGIFKYNSFQYPFGDYLYYTDNNPLFALPFKWFCHNVWDVSAHTMVVLNTVVILNIVLCGLLVFFVFRRLYGSDLIPFLLAVVLPWVNMQVFRIWAGHYAFSFSSFILLAICFVMLWHRWRFSRKRQLWLIAGMSLFSFLTFLAQGYYLAIITIFIAVVLFIYGIYNRKQPFGWFSVGASLVYSVLAFAMTISVIALTDRYLPLRKEGANGYDWMHQKVRFTALYSKYDFQHVSFPLLRSFPRIADPEAAAYLGNVGLYALAVLFIMAVVRKEWRRHIFQSQKAFFASPVKTSLFIGSVVMLFISFGEHYYTNDDTSKGLHLINIFNPLLYIHFFTKRVEQFRSLERFVWPFYFCFYLWIGYAIAYLINQYGRKAKVIAASCIVFLGGAEVYDYVKALQDKCNNENPFSAAPMSVMPPRINLKTYQAILPIPYYFAGSEDYDYTLNDEDSWTRHNYQLSYFGGLPLMSCKMSRTPPLFNIMLMDFVTKDSLHDELRKRLNGKPILVAVNKVLVKDSTLNSIPAPNTPQAELYWKAAQFVERNGLQAIDSLGDVVYYAWMPRK